jgi:Ca-activated chloride channel family protein
MAGEINLTMTLHRQAYQAMPNPQQIYVLLEAMPTVAATGEQAQPVNFCLVLDRSGSMAGEKLRHMKEAAKKIVDRLGAADLLSVVIFDDAEPAELVVPASAVNDRELIKKKIDAILERGGTHMSTGMRLGLQELQKGHTPQHVSSMLLLTDGQTWEDEETCRQLADQCREAGFPIYALGMGVGESSNWDPRLLEDLAVRSGGDWVALDTPEKAASVFENTLRSMQGTAVTNAQLTMRLVEGVTPRHVWRVSPLISRLGHQAVSEHDVQVLLGDIQHGVGQSILADLLIPLRQPGIYRMLQASITYDVPASGLTDQKVSLDVVIPFTEDAALANQTHGRVMNIIERVVAHKLQTQALDEAAAGDAARATQRLRAAATRLLELGETDLAEQANQQASKIEANGKIDIAAAQKMRYATRRLAESELQE